MSLLAAIMYRRRKHNSPSFGVSVKHWGPEELPRPLFTMVSTECRQVLGEFKIPEIQIYAVFFSFFQLKLLSRKIIYSNNIEP